MKLYKQLFLITGLIVSALSTIAQVNPTPRDTKLFILPNREVQLTQVQKDSMISPFDLLTSKDTVNISLYFKADSIADQDSIFIKLGSAQGLGDLANHQIAFDPLTSQLPSGMDYFRSNEHLKIDLGQFWFRRQFYCEVVLQNKQGIKSTQAVYHNK